MKFKNIIQIAGIIDQPEADLLMQCGVEWLGFPLRLSVNREDLSEDEAAVVIRNIPSPHVPVLITYLDRAADIAEFCGRLGVGMVQLHGAIAISEITELKSIAPSLQIIKSLIVKGDNLAQLLESLVEYAPYADAFITDTFDPATGASGATGKVHDWSISRELVENSSKPIILAGGLTPENVRAAILAVRPAGVDAHTGVEALNGRKGPERVRRFVTEAREAFRQLERDEEYDNDIDPEVPVDGVLDLHTFSPKEVKDLVPEYIRACREKGIYQIRIIHGKGTGTLRRTVQALLDRSTEVESYATADGPGGGWGATLVVLRR